MKKIYTIRCHLELHVTTGADNEFEAQAHVYDLLEQIETPLMYPEHIHGYSFDIAEAGQSMELIGERGEDEEEQEA